jgi:WD40 repeat protein
VAFDREGRRILSESRDQTVRVWDAARSRLLAALLGRELACLRGHEWSVESVAFDREGRRIVSGSWDMTVRVWDAASGAELACLRGHDGRVESVAFDREGRRIVSGSYDHTVRVWDGATGDCLEVIPGFGDVAAIAAPASAFPWRAMSRNLETAIEPASGGEAVAWFPAALEHLATHPSGRIWAGTVRNHLYLIRLEGGPDSIPRGGDP